jgi:hypothetical protein
MDCGTDMPLDIVLTNEQWKLICPDDGMLCASCIIRRANELPHVIKVFARIIFADDLQ